MNKDSQVFIKHIQDLITRSYMQNRPYYSEFLSLEESGMVYLQLQNQRDVSFQLYGGYQNAERQILAIMPGGYELTQPMPVSCIRVEPLQFRFHDELSHRDYLGALMNLGIERNLLGDIVIHQETKKGHTYPVAYVFCLTRICDFIIDNLSKIRHTQVACSKETEYEIQYEPSFEELTGTVVSERLDAVLAFLTKQSRSHVAALIGEKKIFINNICIQNASYRLKENDVIRIRGYGKYIYQSDGLLTKKGRLVIHVLKYI